MKDPLAHSLSDYQQFGFGVATLLAGNKDSCQIQRITDDFKNWCLEDKKRCIYATGVEDRVINNAVPILTQIMEFGRVVLQDDTCFTTDQ